MPRLAPSVVLVVNLVFAAGTDEAAGSVDYVRDIKPLPGQSIVSLATGRRGLAGLRLDTAAAAAGAVTGGPAVVRGRLGRGPLIDSITVDDPGERMPLKRPAAERAQVALLKDWVREGARRPRPTSCRRRGLGRALGVRSPVRFDTPVVSDPAWVSEPDRRVHPGSAGREKVSGRLAEAGSQRP